MPVHTSHDAGSPNWVDLMAPDVDAAVDFYCNVFGWQAEEQHDEQGNRVYVMFTLDGKNVAGLGGQRPDMKGVPALWNTYIATDDIDETAAKVVAAGGQIAMEPMQVFTSGKMAVFTDSTGAAFSAWQAQDHIGAQICSEANTWSWNELQNSDLDMAAAFYTEVFGWSYETMQMEHGEYRIAKLDSERNLAGMMTMPESAPVEIPNHWSVYFEVEDIETSISKITEAGGSIIVAPFHVGVGITALVRDPQGAGFFLLQPSQSEDC